MYVDSSIKAIVSFVTLAVSVNVFADTVNVGRLKERVDPIVQRVEKNSDWLASRLQMFWVSKAKDVYVNGETFARVGKDAAPMPTVKYNGTREMECNYKYPDRIEDVVAYDDDEDNGAVTMINKTTGAMEKVELAKTGCNPNAMNRRVISYAKDAAVIYRETRDEKYLPLIRSVVDTYMKGILHRNTPYDLNHGHQQTLVGLVTFEVIHEDAITDMAMIIECLGATREERSRVLGEDNLVTYENAFRHWMENIIAGGVPHNNWNLFLSAPQKTKMEYEDVKVNDIFKILKR